MRPEMTLAWIDENFRGHSRNRLRVRVAARGSDEQLFRFLLVGEHLLQPLNHLHAFLFIRFMQVRRQIVCSDEKYYLSAVAAGNHDLRHWRVSLVAALIAFRG